MKRMVVEREVGCGKVKAEESVVVLHQTVNPAYGPVKTGKGCHLKDQGCGDVRATTKRGCGKSVGSQGKW